MKTIEPGAGSHHITQWLLRCMSEACDRLGATINTSLKHTAKLQIHGSEAPIHAIVWTEEKNQGRLDDIYTDGNMIQDQVSA